MEKTALRARLSLVLAMLFVAALLLGTIALQIFSTEQLTEESGPAVRSTRAVAEALNAALQASGNPRQNPDAFAQRMRTSESIQFRSLHASSVHEAPVEVRTAVGRVPHWFIELLTIPEIGVAFPV